MIAYLFGKPVKKTLEHVVLNVNGVGYKVTVPVSTLCNLEVGKDSELYIETILRDDSISLYGFSSEEEKQIFNKLLKVSKVGPKLAIAILSGLSGEKLISAITGKNIKLLTSIPGVGKKTAERICFDLKEAFSGIEVSPETLTADESVEEEILMALENLGYKHGEVKDIVRKTVEKYGDKPLENMLKIILNDLYNG